MRAQPVDATPSDGGAAPDGVEKFVLGDDATGIVKQKLENLKDFRFDRQRFSGLGDREVALVDLYVGKPKDPAPMLHRVPRKIFIGPEG